MSTELDDDSLQDLTFLEEKSSSPNKNDESPRDSPKDERTLRENEESSGASDYSDGVVGFTPPKDFRFDKLYKAKHDRKTTKKSPHGSHSASKFGKKESTRAPHKSKSMVELSTSPALDMSPQKPPRRHFSIPAVITPQTSVESIPTSQDKDRSALSPVHSKWADTSQAETRLKTRSALPILNFDLIETHPSSGIPASQAFINSGRYLRRRSSLDASAIPGRTVSSPSSSSLRLYESCNEYKSSRRNKLQTLLSVDQDDRLDYAFPDTKNNSLRRHRHPSIVPECPRERNEFYSQLHMTVLHLGIAGATAHKRAEEVSEASVTKEMIHQNIAVQVRAYLQGSSVKDVSDDLALRKLDVSSVIDDILFFDLPSDPPPRDLFRPFSVRAMYTEISTDSDDGKPLETINEEETESVPQSFDDNLDDEESRFSADQFMTSAQARAMEKVRKVLGALDEAEGLYQSFAELGDEHPKYRSPEFVRRSEALQLWLRVTETLAAKLCQMSQLCGNRVDLEPGEDDMCLKSLNAINISWSFAESEQARTTCCERKYRKFVDQYLKKYGLLKTMKLIRVSLEGALLMGRYAFTGERHLQQSYRSYYHRGSSNEDERVPLLKDSSVKPLLKRRSSLFPLDSGGWLNVFEQMNLPSFDRQFLQLARVPLDVMHVCIRKNLDLRLQDNLSILSLKALVKDCRQIIEEAIEVRKAYRDTAMLVTGSDQMKQEQVTVEMEQFEDDLRRLLEDYFSYIQRCNLLGEAGKQSNILQLEWERVKKLCVKVKGGEAQAGRVFCVMVENQVQSVGDYFHERVDTLIHEMHSCKLGEQMKACLQRSCRNFKELFVDMRERIVKTLGFAKLLRKDLEIAADFDVDYTEIVHNLLASDHVQVVLTHGCDGRLLFVPESIADNMDEVAQLLSLNFGRDDVTDTTESGRHYLVILESEGVGLSTSSWPSDKIKIVDTSVEIAIAVADLQISGLKLIVQNFSELQNNCDSFAKAMGNSVSIRNRQTSGHHSVNESISALTGSVISLSRDVMHSCEEAQDHLSHETEDVDDQNVYRDTVHSCYTLGFECTRELIRLVGPESTYAEIGDAMVPYAKRWANFVLTSCERGRGTRPRWATAGLDFLTTTCHPLMLMKLREEDYEELASLVKKCLNHVVGDSSTARQQVSRSSSRRGSCQWSRGYRRRSSPTNLPVFHELTQGKEPSPPPSHSTDSNSSGVGNDSPPLSTTVSLNQPLFITPTTTRSISHQESNQSSSSDSSLLYSPYVHVASGPSDFDATNRFNEIRDQLTKFDNTRDELLRGNRVIGRVIGQSNNQGFSRLISVRQVNFRWQRGKKIGSGKFGTVYCCINMDTSELLAVKQIPFQESNHSDIERIYDEVRYVQDINHPNIVKVYGMERHHDELFLFMEYCGEGTIWDVAKQGLTNDMIRKYTYEITVGMDELHRRHIVHRDIKGANIFITTDGSIKIGDFGLCVQMKNTKTKPEEIKGTAGTAAYMAPEVIHGGVGRTIGRSADIWSLGCVIVEMVTGKIPYCDLDNDWAIMYAVGSGEPPAIPQDQLDELKEGKDFLSKCFKFKPEDRWSTSQLLEHSFLKVDFTV